MVITLLDFNAEDVIQPFKRTCLFLKRSKLPPSIDKVTINITKASNKIVKPETYKEIIRDFIYKTY